MSATRRKGRLSRTASEGGPYKAKGGKRTASEGGPYKAKSGKRTASEGGPHKARGGKRTTSEGGPYEANEEQAARLAGKAGAGRRPSL